MSWGGVPQITTGYDKMLPANDITEPVITSENGRKVNHTTGFRNDKPEAHPLTTTGFESIKKALSWH